MFDVRCHDIADPRVRSATQRDASRGDIAIGDHPHQSIILGSWQQADIGCLIASAASKRLEQCRLISFSPMTSRLRSFRNVRHPGIWQQGHIAYAVFEEIIRVGPSLGIGHGHRRCR
jgi:hypothetical protein